MYVKSRLFYFTASLYGNQDIIADFDFLSRKYSFTKIPKSIIIRVKLFHINPEGNHMTLNETSAVYGIIWL